MHIGTPPDGASQMLWANMALHMAADPQALIAQWHRTLGVDGFLMFSCFGPDTLRELRALYARLGWPASVLVKLREIESGLGKARIGLDRSKQIALNLVALAYEKQPQRTWSAI